LLAFAPSCVQHLKLHLSQTTTMDDLLWVCI
jgi:hypothetical protein